MTFLRRNTYKRNDNDEHRPSRRIRYVFRRTTLITVLLNLPRRAPVGGKRVRVNIEVLFTVHRRLDDSLKNPASSRSEYFPINNNRLGS